MDRICYVYVCTRPERYNRSRTNAETRESNHATEKKRQSDRRGRVRLGGKVGLPGAEAAFAPAEMRRRPERAPRLSAIVVVFFSYSGRRWDRGAP